MIDTAELVRVFGPLRGTGELQQANTSAAPQAIPQHATEGDATVLALVDMLRVQLDAALNRERQIQADAEDREKWLRAELEQERADRRTLEQRLLPPPVEPGAVEPAPVPEREESREGKKDHTDTLALALFALFLAGFAWLILWR